MSEYALETRLLGKEDINFDSNGTGEQTQYTDLNGDTHLVTKLNASHLPTTQETRAMTNGAANVDDAIQELHSQMNGLAGQNGVGLDGDKLIVLSNASTRQTAISAPFRNLGGHTLTFQFPEEGDIQVELSPLEFQGFYNGVLVIDLNGCDIHDNGSFSPEGILRIKNCHCIVRIIGDGRSSDGYGKVIFTSNHYGIAVIHSPSCSVEHIAFESSSGANDYGLYLESGNAYFTSCTFTGCKHQNIKSVYRDYVDDHINDANAHSALFAGKANLQHNHSMTHISGLVDALEGKAAINHSHAVSEITGLSSSIESSVEELVSSGAVLLYDGPFAVQSYGLNPYSGIDVKINGGYVTVCGSSYQVPGLSGGRTFVSSGGAIYLHGSVGSSASFDYVTSAPSSFSSDTFYTMLAENVGGVMQQRQFGNIVTVPWGINGGGGGGGGNYDAGFPDYANYTSAPINSQFTVSAGEVKWLFGTITLYHVQTSDDDTSKDFQVVLTQGSGRSYLIVDDIVYYNGRVTKPICMPLTSGTYTIVPDVTMTSSNTIFDLYLIPGRPA